MKLTTRRDRNLTQLTPLKPTAAIDKYLSQSIDHSPRLPRLSPSNSSAVLGALRQVADVPMAMPSLSPSVSGFLEQVNPVNLQSMSDLHAVLSDGTVPVGDKLGLLKP